MTVEQDEPSMDEGRESSLRVLSRRTPAMSGWQPADVVRRTATRRRRTKWGTGAAVVLTVAVAAALSLDGGSSSTAPPAAHLRGAVHTVDGPFGSIQLVADTQPITAADASSVDAVVAAEQRLSLALLKQVGDGSNVTVSPLSLYLALGMLQNGARGQTADEISAALQAEGLSTADQNAGLATLTRDLAAAAEKDDIRLDSANSLWQQRGFDVKPAFLRALAAYYDSGVWQVDYEHHKDDALAAIDAWTSDNTHGKITKLFDDLDPATVLVFANAIYFHGAWQTPFAADVTEPGQFFTADNRIVTAKFMGGGRGLRGVVADDYQAAVLPYRGGRFEALAVMPTGGTTLSEFVASLAPETIDSIAAAATPDMGIDIPRFTTTSDLNLKPVLTAMGMQLAFTPDADFSRLSMTPTLLDQIIQRDYLQVGEYGTTAAAVTGGAMIAVSGSTAPSVRLDHPFLFLIRDTKTGAILFASEITDPTAA